MTQKTGPGSQPAKKSKNPRHKKTSVAIKRDVNTAKCIKYYLQGHTMQRVADMINEETGQNIVVSTVSKLIAAAVKEWQKEQNQFIEQHKVIEIEKINRLEAEYWDAWHNSKRAVTYSNFEPGKSPRAKQVFKGSQVREGHGDPRFMTGIQWCIDKRCEIIGTNAPQVIEANISGTVTNNTTIRKVVFKSKVYAAAPQEFTQKEDTE